MTPDLEPEIYDQPPFLEIIKRFVLARSFAKVRVLLRDQARHDPAPTASSPWRTG